MANEIISVEYEGSTGLWLVLDNWNHVIGEHRKKDSAVMSARRFAKERAKSVGTVKLEIYKQDGGLSRSREYMPSGFF